MFVDDKPKISVQAVSPTILYLISYVADVILFQEMVAVDAVIDEAFKPIGTDVSQGICTLIILKSSI